MRYLERLPWRRDDKREIVIPAGTQTREQSGQSRITFELCRRLDLLGVRSYRSVPARCRYVDRILEAENAGHAAEQGKTRVGNRALK
jgi:hypothetical protein